MRTDPNHSAPTPVCVWSVVTIILAAAALATFIAVVATDNDLPVVGHSGVYVCLGLCVVGKISNDITRRLLNTTR